MERLKILNLITLVLTFLALVPKMECQIRPPIIPLPLPPSSPHPLCASQFALVNYACATLPFTPGSPPSPPTPLSPPSPTSPDDEEGHRSHKRHGHRHSHSHWHRYQPTPQEDNCCQWAREMDSQCVCEILLRLPPFLTRPLHQYSVLIGDLCEVTYSCGGPI